MEAGQLVGALAPMLLVSVGYIDPGKWVCAVEYGSRLGNNLMPCLILFNLFGILCYCLSAYVTVITGRNLAQICGEVFDKPICIALGIQAELSMICLDVTMIIGIAQGLNMMFGIDLFSSVLLTTLNVALYPLFSTLVESAKFKVLVVYLAGLTFGCYVIGMLINLPKFSFTRSDSPLKSSGENSFALMSLLGLELVHSLITRTLLSRTTSRKLVTDQTLEILYLIMHGLRLDIPSIIINHMIHIQSSRRPSSLPYANLLPYIFKFFHFDLSSDDQETGISSEFDEKSVNKLGIVKVLRDGEEKWEFKTSKDYTASITDTPSSSSAPNLSQVENRLEDLEFGLDTLRADLIDFKGSVSDCLDKNYEMMAVVNSKVNQLFSLCSLNFQATSNIMHLEEEVAKYTREEAQQVLLNCERRVRSRPLLGPFRYEPNIIIVEQYGIIKKYRDDERAKMGFMKRENKIVVEARERYQNKRKVSIKELAADWTEEDGLP